MDDYSKLSNLIRLLGLLFIVADLIKTATIIIKTNVIRSENLINIYTIKAYKYFSYSYYRVLTEKTNYIVNDYTTIIYRITNLNLITKSF